MKYFIDGILHCFTSVSKCIFDSNIIFALQITCGNIGYVCINFYDTQINNGYKGFFRSIIYLPIYINNCYVQKKKDEWIFGVRRIK